MTRLATGVVVGMLLLSTGCAGRLVEVPTERKPAVPVELTAGAVRCPADTVLLTDDEPGSGAGAVPSDFAGRTVLRCDVDYTTMSSSNGRDHFTVSQRQAPLTTELRSALDLPDREYRPGRPCSAAQGGTTAVYLLDGERRSVRVLVPVDDPCQAIRAEVAALLPNREAPADATYRLSRPSR